MMDTVFDVILKKVNDLRNSVEAVSKFANTLWVVVTEEE